jgi:hypothetical protein
MARPRRVFEHPEILKVHAKVLINKFCAKFKTVFTHIYTIKLIYKEMYCENSTFQTEVITILTSNRFFSTLDFYTNFKMDGLSSHSI